MSLFNSNSAIEGMLAGVTAEFNASVRAEILARLTASVQAELVEIADAQAKSITQLVVNYYTDPMNLIGVMQYHLTVNREQVATGQVEKRRDRT